MAFEPTSSALGGIQIAAPTILLTGAVFGVEYQALLAGFAGGLCYVTYVPPTSRLRVATTLAASSLVAGYFAPLLTAMLLASFSWMSEVPNVALRVGAAFWIGLISQSVLPSALQTGIPSLARKLTEKLSKLLGKE